jgi:hypothetical protein
MTSRAKRTLHMIERTRALSLSLSARPRTRDTRMRQHLPHSTCTRQHIPFYVFWVGDDEGRKNLVFAKTEIVCAQNIPVLQRPPAKKGDATEEKKTTSRRFSGTTLKISQDHIQRLWIFKKRT